MKNALFFYFEVFLRTVVALELKYGTDWGQQELSRHGYLEFQILEVFFSSLISAFIIDLYYVNLFNSER
jgi:hypothetical protein